MNLNESSPNAGKDHVQFISQRFSSGKMEEKERNQLAKIHRKTHDMQAVAVINAVWQKHELSQCYKYCRKQ